MIQVMTRCFPPLARRRQYFLLILATMLSVGAATAQGPLSQGKTLKWIVSTSAGIEWHIDVKGGDDVQARVKKVIEQPADGSPGCSKY